METIKLVVWDLDDTFWEGTLAETGVTPVARNLALVEALADRGIPSSIASNNDLDRARDELQRLGAWDWFVCPQIGWAPKGELVGRVVSQAQLRPVNVLFLDDNPRNLEEARFHNPGLNAEPPEFIGELLAHPALAGKADPGRTRLKQYRQLERRAAARGEQVDNGDFLKRSDIRVTFVHDLAGHVDRVHELIERTNQLNYTKRRVGRGDVEDLLRQPGVTSAGVRVVDRFGDYGLVGFFSLDAGTDRLEHFLFSCRILNLGVEQFVYAHLGFPEIEVVGDVVATLDRHETPSWIAIDTAGRVTPSREAGEPARLRVLVKGGCDVGLLAHYLGGYDLDVDEELGIGEINGTAAPRGHTQELVNSRRLSVEDKSRLTRELSLIDGSGVDELLEGGLFETRVWAQDYDVLVLNPMVDYLQTLYRERSTGTIIGYGGYVPVTGDTIDYWVERAGSRVSHPQLLRTFLRYFVGRYENIGQIGPDHLVENLRFIRSNLDARIPFVLINGAEVEIDHPREARAHVRHAELNRALARFVAESDNCWLVDVRPHVRSPGDVTDNIRHYQARAYFGIVADLVATIERASGTRVAGDRAGLPA